MAIDNQIHSNSAKKKAKKELEELYLLVWGRPFDKQTFEHKVKNLSYPVLIDMPLEKNNFIGSTILYAAIAARNLQAMTVLFNQTHKPNPYVTVIRPDKITNTPISAAISDLIAARNIEQSTLQIMIMLMIKNMKNISEIIDPYNKQNILHVLCQIPDEEIAIRLAQEVFKKTTPQEKALLFNQHNTNQKGPNECAAERSRPKLLELFLTESDDQAKFYILQFASQAANFHILSIILKFVPIDQKSPLMEQTALHIAAFSGLSNVVDFLLKQGANPNSRDKSNLTPSEMARTRGYLSIAQTLEAQMATSSQKIVPSNLLWYIAKGNLEEIKRMITKENINFCFPKEKVTPLYYACDKNQIEIARFLIGAGADINQETESSFPLFTAAANGYTDLVKLLLSTPDINVNLAYQGFTTLHVAIQNGHSNIVRLLLERGADVLARTPQGLTPLLIAAEKGHTSCIEALLEFSPEKQIDQQTSVKHQTALHRAVLNQDLPSVKALCRKNPNVEIKNSNSATPFLIATNTTSKIVNLLLPHVKNYTAHGSEINGVKLDPLHLSIICFNFTLMRKLILKFPECITITSILDGKERLPIEIAILFKNYPAVRLLLQNDAELTDTLRQEMRKANDAEFNKILEEYPAENITKTKSVTSPTAPIEKISARVYLASLEFDNEQIEIMKASNQEKLAKKIAFWNNANEKTKSKTYTWFNQRLKSHDVKPIESAIKCFYVLDTDALREQKCPEHIIDMFQQQLPKFSPHHLKKISIDMAFQLETSDGPVNVKPTHELWIPGITDRVLVFQVPSDDNNASLYYGCLYLPNGLHETADMKSLFAQSKSININMGQKKLTPSNSTA